MLDRKLSIFLLLIWLFTSGFASDLTTDTEGKSTEDKQEETVLPKYQVNINIYPLQAHKTSQEEIANLLLLLKEHLSIINKSTQANLDEEQENYLVLEAPQEINQLLETEGYFDSKIQIIPHLKSYDIEIGLQAPIIVKNKVIVLSGSIEKDPAIQEYYRDIFRVWSLDPADIFKQKLWSSSKKLAIREVQTKKYPLAAIKNSYAQIDTTTHSALLHVEIDSGEIIKFGEINVSGAERYPVSIIKNLAGFHKGQDYQEELLLDYQQKLEKDGHYSEVVINPLFSQISNNEVAIFVYVKEQLKKSFGIELTYDTGEGVGTALRYQYYNFLNKGYVFATSISYNKYEQKVSLGVTQPRKSNGRFWTAKTDYFRGSRQDLDTVLWTSGLWYVYTRRTIDTNLGLEYYQEHLRTKQGEKINKSKILMPTVQWKVNHIQTLLRPENGYYISAKLGSTLGTLASTSSAQYAEIYMDYYFTPWERKNGTWLIKAQAGYLSANKPDEVPDELKFKIGGYGSVRGYPIDSIGIQKGPYIFGDKAKFAATVEYQKPVTESVSIAVFHDVGDVKNNFKRMKLKHSTGVGVRWFSIVAPLSFDVAYGHQRKKFGWHLNLGAKF